MFDTVFTVEIGGSDGAGTTALMGVADAVEQVLNTALEHPAHLASEDELCEWLIRSPRLRTKFEALLSTVAATADRADAARKMELRKTDQVVGSETGADPAVTRADVRVGTWVADFPRFEAAFAAGLMTREHLELIRKGIDNVRTHAALAGDQEFFVEQAAALSFADFKTTALYWLHAVDPDGEEPKEQVINTRLRAVRLPDGSVSMTALFDPLSGTAVLSALSDEEQRLFRKDAEDGITRSNGKRRADALIGLLTKGHEHGGSGVPRALINIVMSQTVAEKALERLDNPLVEVGLDPQDVDGRCEFIDGQPLHPELALATLGVATLRRHVMDAKGRMLDVSLNARSFPQWMKDAALIVTRGRCAEPGCDAPFAWLVADHRKPHSKHGPTQLDNCDPLCDPGNKAKSDTWIEPDEPDEHQGFNTA